MTEDYEKEKFILNVTATAKTCQSGDDGGGGRCLKNVDFEIIKVK